MAQPEPAQHPATSIWKPALNAGIFTGGAGFLVGGTVGIIKAQTPFLFATASGIQTGLLGSTFWATRSAILQAWDTRELTSRDTNTASALSGAISGGLVGAVTRGRANALPGALMVGLFGFTGQYLYSWRNSAAYTEKKSAPGFWKRMSEKAWSPVRVMNDEEYAAMLKEKVLKLDVEIAVLDDKITAQKQLLPREEERVANGPKQQQNGK